jgi:hypothetical protein
LDELRATTVSKTEFEAFKADVGTFQRDVLARLADIAARVPRRRPAKRR